MCAGGQAGEDSCAGDSGSALMVETWVEAWDPRMVQVGVVSFGQRMCAKKSKELILKRMELLGGLMGLWFSF